MSTPPPVSPLPGDPDLTAASPAAGAPQPGSPGKKSKGDKPVKVKKPRSPNTMAWGVAGVAGVVTLGAGFLAAQTLFAPPATVTVITTTVPLLANTALTADNVTTVLWPADAVPVGALTVEQLQQSTRFAKVALPVGQVITETVTQTATRTATDIPAGMVIASFEVDPADAVAGKIQPGSYVDILSSAGGLESGAEVVLGNVYVLDAQVSATSGNNKVDASEQPGPNNPALYGGVPTLYTVAVTPEQALVLAESRGTGLYLVLRPVVPGGPATPTPGTGGVDVVTPELSVPAVPSPAAPSTTTPSPAASSPAAGADDSAANGQ